MRIRWRNLELPSRVIVDRESLTPNYGRFMIEPFERGFGHTIGNGLRRVLLSSLEGTAVRWFRMNGALHESHGIYTHREYRQFVESAIEDVAESGSVVILGHGGQFALAGREDTFRVLITASVESRVAELVADGATPDGARESIRRRDAERKGFFKDAVGEDWLDPSHYDLVISADNYDAEMAAEIICHAANLRTRQAVRGAIMGTPARRRLPGRIIPVQNRKSHPQAAS